MTPDDFMPRDRKIGNPDKEAFIAFIKEGARIQREEMEAKLGKV
jgi:hypothetical protein